MRCIDRKTFLAMPAGTIYCKGKPWAFESICIKGDTLSYQGADLDWFVKNPAWVDADSSGQAFERLESMLRDGASFPMEDSICRDGCFDEGDIFLVFEREDLTKLREHIDAALSLEENPPEEVEITDEMIAAGEDVLLCKLGGAVSCQWDAAELAKKIFRVMAEHRPSKRKKGP